MKRSRLLLAMLVSMLALLGGAVATGCGGSPACTQGQQISCACPAGNSGVQVCAPDGMGYGPCECGGDGGNSAGGEGDSPGPDADGDGWGADWGDCDDNNPLVNPDQVEVQDGIDNNCDGSIDEQNGGGSAVSTDKIAGVDYCFAKSFGSPVGTAAAYSHCNDGDGWYVYTEFHAASTCGGWNKTTHLGEDWNKETGGATDLGEPVRAIANGVVVFIKDTYDAGWGRLVIVRHDAPPGAALMLPGGGSAAFVYSQYAHLQNIAVSKGAAVSKGDKLAEIGPHPNSPHLHWEVSGPDATSFPGPGYSQNSLGRLDPTEFIAANNTVVAQCGAQGQPCCIECPNQVACSGGLQCQAGICQGGSCADECQMGQTRCLNASTQQTCGNYDADSCYEWGGDQNCTCANGVCELCGNNVKDPGEQCDGNQLGGATCQSQGFDGGTLSCSQCLLNTSGCCNDTCVQGTTQCLNGNTQQTCGNYDADACFEWGNDTSCTCVNGQCCTDTYSISSYQCNNYSPASGGGAGGGEIFKVCGQVDPATGFMTIKATKFDNSSFGSRPYQVRVSAPGDPPCGPSTSYFTTVNQNPSGIGTNTLTFSFQSNFQQGQSNKEYCITASTKVGDVGYNPNDPGQQSWWYSKKIGVVKVCQ